jgi:diguanylate cyclase (GGDEF)-like protein
VKAVVVHRDPSRRARLVRLLEGRGYDVGDGDHGGPGLFVLDAASLGGAGEVRRLRRDDRVLVVLVERAPRSDIESFLAAGAASVLVEPLNEHRLWAGLVSAEYLLAERLRHARAITAYQNGRERSRVLEEVLTRQAFTDTLTGLANRALFMDRTEHALARAGRHGAGPALLFIDLDGFKQVNDRFGHAVGDAALAAVARQVLELKREGDTAARLGGDEFTLLLESIERPQDAVRVADRILRSLRRPLMVGDHQIGLTASVGVAFAEERTSARELMRRADAAMYRAKRLGKNRYVVYEHPDAHDDAAA